MNTNIQFESLNFVAGSQKTLRSSRLSKVVLVASVVLLVAGAYYYGANSAHAATHKSTTLFRSYYTPRRESVSAVRSPIVYHSGKQADHFTFLASPVQFGPNGPEPLSVRRRSLFWGVNIKREAFVGPSTAPTAEIKALTFQKSFDDHGILTHWSAEVTDQEYLDKLNKSEVLLVICVTGSQFSQCERWNSYCSFIHKTEEYNGDLMKLGNYGIIHYGADEDCNLSAKVTLYENKE